MDEERKQTIVNKKKELYSKIRHLVSEKNKLEMELTELKTEYSVLDRELAEMNITYCQACEGVSRRKAKQVTLSIDQVRDIAARLGVTLSEES